MQAILPAVFVGIFIVLILGPPVSFLRTTYRSYRHWRSPTGLFWLLFWLAVASVPLVLNLAYLRAAWPTLIQGQFERGPAQAMALLISWTALWASVVMRRTRRRKRRLLH